MIYEIFSIKFLTKTLFSFFKNIVTCGRKFEAYILADSEIVETHLIRALGFIILRIT